MALLRVRVLIGTTPLPDTVANQRRMFVFSGVNDAAEFGNVRRKVNRTGEHAYNLNNPSVAGAVAVTAAQPVFFDDNDLENQSNFAGQLIEAVEKGYIEVTTEAAPGAPLNRAAIMAYV